MWPLCQLSRQPISPHTRLAHWQDESIRSRHEVPRTFGNYSVYNGRTHPLGLCSPCLLRDLVLAILGRRFMPDQPPSTPPLFFASSPLFTGQKESVQRDLKTRPRGKESFLHQVTPPAGFSLLAGSESAAAPRELVTNRVHARELHVHATTAACAYGLSNCSIQRTADAPI